MESDSEMGLDEEMNDSIMHMDSDDGNKDDFRDEDQDDYIGDDSEDEDQDDDDEEDEGEEGSGEDNEEGEHGDEDVQKGEELDELEKEYRELQSQEQDIWRNLKHRTDEDIQKGQAVKNQREQVKSLYCEADNEVSEAYSDLIASSKKTLDSILELQQALMTNNPSITRFEEGYPVGDSKQLDVPGVSDRNIDEEWLQISKIQSRMNLFRNKSVDKWHRKTQVTTGAAAIKDKLHAFNQSISEQVAAYMRDPSKMIKGMQQNRSAVAVFGNVPCYAENDKQEETSTNGDPELLDDSEFYQQLLKEFFETVDPSSSEVAFYALKRLQTKKRKNVDRRASKSRKIRYHVHEKIVNFMAPQPADIPPTAIKLFENLFGLKSQKSASVS
ncbi:protein BFR2-like isoform X2 [Salvia splendens]|uniref:protein BFR2-like isoform X2 n=1 Tax=Salvia splendens TaxID=180675 RepID=UPI001C27C8FE|nr:protein BFR2-like isoform X2 [Salvia splendens]